MGRLKAAFALPIPRHFEQKHRMENPPEPTDGLKGLVRWAMTPPQSVAVYFVILLLVLGMSFYAGTLSPKKQAGTAPAPVTAPRN
jgi:hypothetical protein